MKKPLTLLLLIYVAIILITVMLAVMAAGCSATQRLAQGEELTAVWTTDGDTVVVQCYEDGWRNVAAGEAVGSVSFKSQANIYRLMAVKDKDTSYSRVVWVK